MKLALLTAALLPATLTFAQDGAPPELKSLQATYQEEHLKLTTAYTDRLKALRGKYTKSQDLYEAALVYEEIKRAESQLPGEPAPRPEGLITFPVGDVEIVSAVWGVRSSVVDVTRKVVETLERGEKVKVTYTNLGDPRPYSNKDIVVTYIHQGKLKIIGVGAGKALSYEQLVTPPPAE